MRLKFHVGIALFCLTALVVLAPAAVLANETASRALTVEIIGPADANLGEYASYEIVVTNSSEQDLTGLTVWSDALGYSDTLASLPVGQSRSFSARYGPISEADMPGPLKVDAAVKCAEGLVAEAWWVVDLTADYGTSFSTDGSTRSDVSVIIEGGWDGIPIRFWVEDEELETHYTATNAAGLPQAMWTIYPPAGQHYSVRVEPQFTGDFDPAEWDYRLTKLEGGSAGYGTNGHDYAGCLIPSSSQTVFYFQLESSSAPTSAVTLEPASTTSDPVAVPADDSSNNLDELPHTGIMDDVNAAALFNRVLLIIVVASTALLVARKH